MVPGEHGRHWVGIVASTAAADACEAMADEELRYRLAVLRRDSSWHQPELDEPDQQRQAPLWQCLSV